MKQPPFATIFDLDGVLLNTWPAQLVAYERIAERFGFHPNEVHGAGTTSGSMHQRYHKLQELRPFDADFDTFANTILEITFAELERQNHLPDPQLLALLETLRAHGVPVAVGTSALKHSALRKLTLVQLHEAFEIIVTANVVEHHKPHPEVFLEAAKRLGVPADKCIVIEDAEGGIRAAKAAGMKVVGYRKYSVDPEEVKDADLIINSFEELDYHKLHKLIAGKQ